MNNLRFLIVVVLSIGFTSLSISQPNTPEYPSLTPASRAAIIDSVATTLIDYYVFPDKGDEMAKLIRRNLKKGTYDQYSSLPEFTERLTADIRSVTEDQHLNVNPMPPENIPYFTRDRNHPDSTLILQRLADDRYENFGFEKIERLTGNVGYIKLNRFTKTKNAGQTAIAAMNFVGYCDALIFDLRDNGGGNPSMIQLLTSYLFDEPKHLNSFYCRDTNGERTEQYWTQAYVEGPRLTEIPVYVLTSSSTFSAAEEFTYNLKNMKRAKSVGDTTRGGAHPVKGYGFPSLRVQMGVPYGSAVNPISKTNWEGVGVYPDIPCNADSALEIAHLDAMKQLREKTTDETRLLGIDWAIESIESILNPYPLSLEDMQAYTGNYDPRRVYIENGVLVYQRGEAAPHELIPFKQHWFRVKDLDYFRVGFEMGEDGRAAKIIGLYSHGYRDENERTE